MYYYNIILVLFYIKSINDEQSNFEKISKLLSDNDKKKI